MRLKSKTAFILVLSLCVGFVGCKEDRPVLDPAGSKIEGINANWEMVGATVIDIASIQQKSLDVSSAFIGSKAMRIDFDSTDFSYTVDKGFAPNYFGTSGTWAFDNNETPTSITLTTSDNREILLTLSRTIRPVDANLVFKMNRYIDGKEDPYIAYEFTFARTN